MPSLIPVALLLLLPPSVAAQSPEELARQTHAPDPPDLERTQETPDKLRVGPAFTVIKDVRRSLRSASAKGKVMTVSAQTDYCKEVASELGLAELDEVREWFCYTKPIGPSIKISATAAFGEQSGFCVIATGTEVGGVEKVRN